jgi:hypothetical protein
MPCASPPSSSIPQTCPSPDPVQPVCKKCGCGCGGDTGVCPACGCPESSATDIGSQFFSVSRQFASRLQIGSSLVNPSFGLGTDWMFTSLPYLCSRPDNSVAINMSPCEAYWFDCQSGQYVERYGGLQTLTYDSVGQQFQFSQCDGQSWTFDQNGNLQKTTDPGGNSTLVGYSGGQLSQVQTTVTNSDGTQTVEIYVFQYLTSGAGAGQIGTITLSRQVAGGPPAAIRRVQYGYFGSGELAGNAGDLKLVTVQIPEGTAWVTKDVTYYRSYQSIRRPAG